MKLGQNSRLKVNVIVLGISIFVWILLLTNSGHKAITNSTLALISCGITTQGDSLILQKPSAISVRRVAALNSFPGMLTGWLMMVIAMMLPKLINPIKHVCTHSFKHRRLSLSLLFVAGYISVWMLAGIGMIAIPLVMYSLFGNSYLPVMMICIIAIAWQFSPIKQQCLNKGHEHPVIAAFGETASRDAFVFGLNHAVWCVGSCWALMLLPMLLPGVHNLIMIIVTLMMSGEHLEHPRVPQWRVNFRGKLFRIVVAQTQLRLKRT